MVLHEQAYKKKANDSHHDRGVERARETMFTHCCRNDDHKQSSFLDTKRFETSGHRLRYTSYVGCSKKMVKSTPR